MPGFKDWQRITQWWGDTLYANASLAVTAAGVNLGNWQISAWKSVYLYAFPGGAMRVHMSWQPAVSPGFSSNSSRELVAAPFNIMGIVVPNLGQQLGLSLYSAANITTQLAVIPSNQDALSGTNNTSLNLLLQVNNRAIAPGVADVWNLPFYTGPAKMVIANVGQTLAAVVVRSLDETGFLAIETFEVAPGTPGVGVTYEIYLPPMWNQIVVTNGGIANNYYLWVTPVI